MVTDASLSQLLNAEAPIEITESGIMTDVTLLL